MEYTLNTDKWVCGPGSIKNTLMGLGRGESSLLNSCGNMCCLGQFSLQAGLQPDDIEGFAFPWSRELRDRTPPKGHEWLFNGSVTRGAFKLARVNDSKHMTVNTKLDRIRRILAEEGHTLRVIGTAHLPFHGST